MDIIHEKDSLLACLRIKFEAVVYVHLSPCCKSLNSYPESNQS